MKKILIICLAVIVFLTGCDISTLWEGKTPDTETPNTETPETETPKTEADKVREEYPDLPMSETVTLGQLIKKEDVVYINHTINNFHSPTFLQAISYDIDKLFSILVDPNSDKIFITDTVGVKDIYDVKWDEARANQFSADDYVSWSFYGENGEIGVLTVYTSGFMKYYIPSKKPTTKDLYFCLGYSNVSVSELEDLLYKGEWWK